MVVYGRKGQFVCFVDFVFFVCFVNFVFSVFPVCPVYSVSVTLTGKDFDVLEFGDWIGREVPDKMMIQQLSRNDTNESHVFTLA